MALQTVGDPLFARDEGGRLRTRIATVFPRARTLVTVPGIHATQRIAFVEAEDRRRLDAHLPPLSESEQEAMWLEAVDLVLDDDPTPVVLIRPDPADMELAFEADECLQEAVPKTRIKFLHVLDPKVREAIRRRGECWRISPLPQSPDEMKQMIEGSRIGIGGRDLYYYNKASGSRILTHQHFCDLGNLDEAGLRGHLAEIKQYSSRTNRLGRPEVDFFMAGGGAGQSLAAAFEPYDFASMDEAGLRAAHEALCRAFGKQVPAEYRRDDLNNPQWRSRMFAALIGQTDKEVSEEALLGLSAEFFMQVEWLPGGRIEDGELIFDSVFEDDNGQLSRCPGHLLCDEKARGFIFNFIRDYGDLEYVNVGRVTGSLSTRPDDGGRRVVYVAEIKQRQTEKPILRIIRLQKWGVREHLDEGKDLLASILEAEEYTEYILDRRLGCRQLGMNLPPRATARKINERYAGYNGRYHGLSIWTAYFERDYIPGLATDKLPTSRFTDADFALGLARVLGRAAAPNLIVGRCDLVGNVVFDDGDELVIENDCGVPTDVIVADHTGTFVDYRGDLRRQVPAYAAAVRRKASHAADPRAFAETFLAAFLGRFTQIQQEYRRRRRAFDTLFKHRRRDEGGSFAYRWERVLARLHATDGSALAGYMREQMTER